MNIVLITPYYEPDLGPSSPLVTMLSEDLTSLGHEVTVIAAVPHFPSGQVKEGFRGGLWRWDVLRGVKVCRLWVPSGNRANLLHRLFVFLIYQILSVLAGLTVTGDVVIITNPAIETILPYLLFNKIRNIPIIYCVWDLYPEVGVQVGVFRHRFIISVVNILENYCLNRAAVVQSLANNFVDNLNSRIKIRYKTCGYSALVRP